MIHKLIVKGFDSGLNELINSRVYVPRTHKYRNPEKTKNDALFCKHIKYQLRGLKINKPIFIHYHFFCKDMRRDKMNVASAADKSLQDSLQLCGVIKNDGWKEIYNVDFTFAVDTKNPRIEIDIEEVE